MPVGNCYLQEHRWEHPFCSGEWFNFWMHLLKMKKKQMGGEGKGKGNDSLYLRMSNSLLWYMECFRLSLPNTPVLSCFLWGTHDHTVTAIWTHKEYWPWLQSTSLFRVSKHILVNLSQSVFSYCFPGNSINKHIYLYGILSKSQSLSFVFLTNDSIFVSYLKTKDKKVGNLSHSKRVFLFARLTSS
jgi:hypothetical protein